VARGIYRSRATPESIIGSLCAWSVRFPVVSFIFGETRELSKKITWKILFQSWQEAAKAGNQ